MTLSNLNSRLTAIEKRNARVETDKAWETSLTRKIILIIFTYLSVGLYMSAINIDRPWLNAIIPSLGFLLSTLTLPFFKSLWVKYCHSD
jgi:hypothetical protein